MSDELPGERWVRMLDDSGTDSLGNRRYRLSVPVVHWSDIHRILNLIFGLIGLTALAVLIAIAMILDWIFGRSY